MFCKNWCQIFFQFWTTIQKEAMIFGNAGSKWETHPENLNPSAVGCASHVLNIGKKWTDGQNMQILWMAVFCEMESIAPSKELKCCVVHKLTI